MLVRPVTELLSCFHTVFMSPDSSALLMRATDDSISTATVSSGWVRLCCAGEARGETVRKDTPQHQGNDKFHTETKFLGKTSTQTHGHEGIKFTSTPSCSQTEQAQLTYFGALLLQSGQLLLIQISRKRIHLGQLGFRIH